MKGTVIDGIDYGPLACLVGVWRGDTGMDVAPDPDGAERNPYAETLVFEAAGQVRNAEEQTLSVVRYHQAVRRLPGHEVLHDQIGYWLWDPAARVVVQTLTIPRGVSLQASGTAMVEGDGTVLEVSAVEGDGGSGIVQTSFMQAKARTKGFRNRLTVRGDVLSYSQTTLLEIYGTPGFEHTDGNSLQRDG